MTDALDRVAAKFRALQRRRHTCSYSDQCDVLARWHVRAGTAGTGQYYDGHACDQHLGQIKKRAQQASRYAALHVTPVEDAPPPPPEQPTLI